VCGTGQAGLTPRIIFFDREMGKGMVERFEMKKDVKN